MTRQIIETSRAPAAIGPYSQAVRQGEWVFLSGQVAIDPARGRLIDGDIAAQTRQVLSNLRAVCEAAGGSLDDIVKLTIYLTDLAHFATVNELMADTFSSPYPARATVGVAALPLGAAVEMEAVLGL